MAELNLPVIDLSKAESNHSRRELADELVNALKTVGFLFIENVPGYSEDEIFKWCKWFFALPEKTKSKLYRQFWIPENKNVYRGSFPLQEGETSYKEGFEIGQDTNSESAKQSVLGESNVWPEADDREEFQNFMTSYFNMMWKTSLEVCRLICLGCGLDEKYLEPMFFPNSLSTLRLLHYPLRKNPVPEVAMEGGVPCCCAEHGDTGFITLLTTFNNAGLQLKLDSGKWIDVPCRKDSLVMNIGNLLSEMTGAVLRATRHRVVDTGVDRLSVPFFLEPDFDAEIGSTMPCFPSEDTPKEKKPYGDWLVENVVRFQEYRHLKKFIREKGSKGYSR